MTPFEMIKEGAGFLMWFWEQMYLELSDLVD